MGTVSSKIILLIAAIYVAKILGPESFGKWGILRSTVSMFSIFLGFGIGVASTKYLAEYKESNN